MTIRCYRRDGTPYPDSDQGMAEWGRDRTQKRVAETTLPDGKWISTVWIGLDHRWNDDGPPLIFETMVFPERGKFSELDCERYSTEEEALVGHKAMVAKWEHPRAGSGDLTESMRKEES